MEELRRGSGSETGAESGSGTGTDAGAGNSGTRAKKMHRPQQKK